MRPSASAPRRRPRSSISARTHPNRVRAEKDEAAIKAISPDFKFVNAGKFTVGDQSPGIRRSRPMPPTPRRGRRRSGHRAVARRYARPGARPGVRSPGRTGRSASASGKYDAVISNVTVTEERKEKFDFSTYRKDVLGFYVKSDSKITAIKEPKDVAGLKVITGAGTNQEKIMLEWDRQNVAAGPEADRGPVLRRPRRQPIWRSSPAAPMSSSTRTPRRPIAPSIKGTDQAGRHRQRRLAADGRDCGDDTQGQPVSPMRSPIALNDLISERQIWRSAETLEPRVRGDRQVPDQPARPAEERLVIGPTRTGGRLAPAPGRPFMHGDMRDR